MGGGIDKACVEGWSLRPYNGGVDNRMIQLGEQIRGRTDQSVPAVECRLLPVVVVQSDYTKTLQNVTAVVSCCPYCGGQHCHCLGPDADRLHRRVSHCKAEGLYELHVDQQELATIKAALSTDSNQPRSERARQSCCIACGGQLPQGRLRACSDVCARRLERARHQKYRLEAQGDRGDKS